MRERLGSGPRIVRALFAAILALGVPIAIALPTDLNGKVYASGAVALIAAAAAILAAALVRRRKEPAEDPSGTGRWSLELLRRPACRRACWSPAERSPPRRRNSPAARTSS